MPFCYSDPHSFRSATTITEIDEHLLNQSLSVFLGKYDVVGRETNDGTTRFFVVGDWGGLPVSPFDTPSEVAVADAMGQMGLKLNTSFQLALGDNFYYDGVKAVNDSRFQVNPTLGELDLLNLVCLVC